jgi:hypothetical protein
MTCMVCICFSVMVCEVVNISFKTRTMIGG